jgi:hypothetical protein
LHPHKLVLQLAARPKIVGVEESDILAARLGNSPVPGRRRSEIAVITDDTHARVAKDVRQHPGEIRAGTVVNQNQLEIGEGLAEDAPHRRRKRVLPPMSRHDDSDSRRAGRRLHGLSLMGLPVRGKGHTDKTQYEQVSRGRFSSERP